MNCDRIRHLISEGYDRRLTGSERMEIADHIQSCAGCARFERTLRSGLDGVSHLPEIAPSPELWEAVHTRTAMAPGLTPTRLAKQAGGMLGAAAAVALVAVLTIFLLSNHIAGNQPPANNQVEFAAGTSASPTASAPVASSFMEQNPATSRTPSTSAASPNATEATTPATAVTAEATASVASVAPPTETAVPATTKVDEQTAEDTVVGYFHAINLQDYAAAYDLLGSALQQNQSLTNFTSGYAGTKHDTLTITAMKPDQSGQMVAVIYLDAEQTDGSVRHYHGEYVVGYEGDTAKIVDATVSEDVPATPTPSPEETVKACRAANLSAQADYQGATGSMAGSIILTNTGSGACVLRGTPKMQLLDGNGQPLKTEQKTMTLDGTEQAVTLEPGQQASLFFVWANWCPAGTAETAAASPIDGGVSFQVTLPHDGGSFTVAAKRSDGTPDTLVPRCDALDRASTLSVGSYKSFPAS
jgi:hypothetical protein